MNDDIHQQAVNLLEREARKAERASEVDHEGLAKSGTNYASRQEIVAAAEKVKPRAEALRYALQRLRKVGPGET